MSPDVPCLGKTKVATELPARAMHIALLVSQGRTVGEIAESLKINRKTVSRLKGDHRFAQLVRDLQAATIERSVSILVHARVRAANTMITLLNSQNPAIALRAATMILEHSDESPSRV